MEGIFFWAFAVAFAVKIPLFPFHFWMPAAYKNAPWMGTIFMSALLSKMGIYGFFRVAIPLFPSAAQSYATIFLVLAVISILYAASIAMIQKDLKMVITYSSMSHLGLIMVGIFSFHSLAWNGAILFHQPQFNYYFSFFDLKFYVTILKFVGGFSLEFS